MPVNKDIIVMNFLLPEGYPSSVSHDYIEYQIWDTLQGFMSYLRNIILSISYVKGIGVKDNLVSPVYTILIRDSTGIIAGLCAGNPILTKRFSNRQQLKKWRIICEILRATAGIIEIYSAYNSTGITFIAQQSSIAVLQSAAQVISIQVRTSLMTHFALENNISDCAAKEGNQDRAIKLLGIPLAVVLIQHVQHDIYSIWISYYLIILVQLALNLLAMKALKF